MGDFQMKLLMKLNLSTDSDVYNLLLQSFS